MKESVSVEIRPMQESDLDVVTVLEKLCFPTPWSRAMYAHEISANPYGSYWVLDAESERPTAPGLVAYGGIWLIADEAHVTTLASHPAWRRRGLAGRLLVHLLRVARTGGATLATLEARADNRPAIQLYEKLGFVEVGVRRQYYADTGEDARLLTLYGLDRPEVWAQIQEISYTFEVDT